MMENISVEFMAHHSCQISDEEENIPAGIVRSDYSHWKYDIIRRKNIYS